MSDKISESSSVVVNKPSDINQEIFGYEQEKIKKEIRSGLGGLKDKLMDLFVSEESKKENREQSHTQQQLSLKAREYLDKHREELIRENPDKACIVVYLPAREGSRVNIAKKLCIPRTNSNNEILKVSGFTLTPVPKSNGYNTEYIIKDREGRTWTQLAILFPAETPEFRKKNDISRKIDSLLEAMLIQKEQLSKIPKTHKTRESRKKKEDSISTLDQQIAVLGGQLQKLGNPPEFTYFSYIPYRKGLNTEENRKQGFEYLSDSMKNSYKHKVGGDSNLGALPSNIPSLSIAKAIPWQYPCILNLIERMDFEVYFDGTGKNLKPEETIQSTMDAQLGKSLTTFGVNTSDAFNRQRSKVGAQGVGQIMPGTYDLYRNSPKYGQLFPEPDFDKAARDHETSFRLQVAHFDDQIFQFPDAIKKNWKELMNDPDSNIGIIALLAAGYNGSMIRIMKEVFGKEYREKPLSLSDCKSRLTVVNIRNAMKIAQDSAIAEIQSENKPRKVYNKKKKKNDILPPLPLNEEQKGRIAVIIARYKESMTYVLKAEYVWGYLKKNYKDQF